MWEESDRDMKSVVKDFLHVERGGGGRYVCFRDCDALLWVLQLAIFQRRLKSVDILERFKGVIFQSGGSLCDVSGWPAAPYRRY